MFPRGTLPTIPLPKTWHKRVKSAVLHVISLAHYGLVSACGWAANSVNARVRSRAESARLSEEVALLRGEIRIKDARMARVHPQRRPHYPPHERMAILELRAARGWSLAQTARTFLVTAETVASWGRRVDEQGLDALVQVPEPVNKFPAVIGYLVSRLKALCPGMGKRKIAETLARAGLHVATTTVGRMLRHKPRHDPRPQQGIEPTGRTVTAKYPNHVWHVDLTLVPIGSGFWCWWLPFALPQRWPFGWWVAVCEDHFSRRAIGYAVFKTRPSSEEVRAFLGRTIAKAQAKPRHLICDKGREFWCDGFKACCRRRGIRPRFGAVGKHGSLAIVERLILTLKSVLRCLPVVPLRREAFKGEVAVVLGWYNGHRPHTTLGGRTPDEVYFNRRPANRMPRWEPRARWPRGSPCAKPRTLVKGQSGAWPALEVEYLAGRKHLPIVGLKRAA